MKSELRHIARLQEQNRLLAECLADERKLRKKAFKWYKERLNSPFWPLYDYIALTMTDFTKRR